MKALTAHKQDQAKIKMHLLDPEFLEGMAKVLTFGAEKYSDNNWRNGIELTRLYSAAQRHLNQYAQGYTKDMETGESHLLHASCCLMFMHWLQEHRPECNDFYHADPQETQDELATEPQTNGDKNP